MKIRLSQHAELKLTTWSLATQGLEFSGLGIVERGTNEIYIVDVDLLGVGSPGYTEFPAERQRSLPLDPGRKLWFHRHPIGNGDPGTHNWSGRDNQTAEREPLGGIPELVQWSVSIVLTPGGWVGRIDFYVPTLKTFHVAVEPRHPSDEVKAQAMKLVTPELQNTIDGLKSEYKTLRNAEFDADYVIDDEITLDDFMGGSLEVNEPYCPECGLELILDDSIETATEAIDLYTCDECGNTYFICTPFAPKVYYRPGEAPGWKQSFMQFWKGK